MKLLIASHNTHKIQELTPPLTAAGFDVCDARDYKLPEPDENGKSFITNARIKAVAAMAATGMTVLADDSGLVIENLSEDEEFPGVDTAPYAKSLGGHANAVSDMFTRLNGRSAECHYTSVLMLLYPDGREIIAEARVEGVLRPEPKGTGTFGFDPWFEMNSTGKRFAELSVSEKNAASHRGLALQNLLHQLRNDRELRAVS